MSMKPFITRGKASPEWTSYDFTSEYRNRSAQRGYTTGRNSPYKSEFDLDGSLHRRSTFYSPPRLSPRSSRAYLAAKAAALGFPRSGGVSDWSRDAGSPSMSRANNLSPQLPPYRAARGSEAESTQPAAGRREQQSNSGANGGSGASQNVDDTRHRDLKRKMVFDLHKEINKPTHTTHLEEISDIDKITDICFSNLRLMMENKKHRKYLHHMNNNALVMRCMELEDTSFNGLNVTNNSIYKERTPSSMNARKLAMDGNLARKASLKPSEMLNAVSPIDPLKVRGPKVTMPSPLKFDFKEKKKTEKESKMGMGSSKLETVRQEDPSQYFLTELEDQIESSKNESFKPAAKQVPLMTPEEILACHYLRLNQDQVARLEKCIRDKGQDPGVHCHMDVTNYDVFSEIRRIRKAQKFGTTFEVGTYDEEDEDSLKEDKLRNDLSKQMPLNSDTLGTFKGKNPKTISSPKTKLPKI